MNSIKRTLALGLLLLAGAGALQPTTPGHAAGIRPTCVWGLTLSQNGSTVTIPALTSPVTFSGHVGYCNFSVFVPGTVTITDNGALVGSTAAESGTDASGTVFGTFSLTRWLAGGSHTLTATFDPASDIPLSASGSISIPGAPNYTYTSAMNSQLLVPAPGLLSGVVAPAGDSLSVHQTGGCENSAVCYSFGIGGDGSFYYTPAPGYHSSFGFSYTVHDNTTGLDFAPALVTILVTPVPPVAANQSYTVQENSALISAAPGLLANSSVPSPDHASAVLVAGPAHGTLTLSASVGYPNGTGFTYTPNVGYAGSDSFTYQVEDSTSQLTSNTATVLLTITPAGMVTPAASTTTLTTAVGSNPSSLTLTATVNGPQGDTFTPTGTVTFWHDGNLINSRPLTNGTYTYSVVNYPTWPNGTNKVWVTYSGDNNFTSSRSATVSLQVG